MMMPMNNMGQLVQKINMVMQTNAKARQIVQSIMNKPQGELEQFVRNMCRERGTTPEELARSLGIQIPSNR